MAPRRELLWGASVVALTGVVFASSLPYPFITFDDAIYVTQNPGVLAGLSWQGVAWAFTTTTSGHYTPLTWLSLQADATLWGNNATGFRATNIALHALTALVLFAALLRLRLSPGLCAVSALLFSLHPLRVESVVWVTERKDVLSGLLGALACLFYLRFVESNRWSTFALSTLAMVASCLAKPMLVTLPAAFMLLRAVNEPVWPPTRRAAIEWATWAALILPIAWLSMLWGKVSGTTSGLYTVNWTSLGADIPRRMGLYLYKTVAPMGLSIFYPKEAEPSPLGIGLGLLGALSVLALAFVFRRRALTVVWALAWFAVAMLPVIGLVPIGYHDIAERFTYWPHVGLVPALTLAAYRLVPARLHAFAGLVAVLAYGSATLARVPVWANSITLYSDAIDQFPDSEFLRVLRAEAYRQLGDYENSLSDLESLESKGPPWPPRLQASLGLINAYLGRFEKAEVHFELAESHPRAEAFDFNNHALALTMAGRLEDAIAVLRRAQRLRRADAQTDAFLADVLKRRSTSR